MKRRISLKVTLAAVIAVMTTVVGIAPPVSAAATWVETITPSKTSTQVNTAVTLSIVVKRYKCSKEVPSPPAPAPFYYYPINDTSECNHYVYGGTSTPYDLSPAVLVTNAGAGGQYTISVSGSGNTLSASTVTVYNGRASVTLKSSVAETKTIKLIGNVKGEFVAATTSVKFTSASSSTTTTTPSAATSTNTTTTTPKAPTAPKLATTKIDGATVDASKPVSVDQDKPLVLSGKTVANGTVTLTIHSTPRTATTKADKNGNWTYIVTGLEPGDHYVEAKVTDPKTKKTSSTTRLLAFKVVSAKLPATDTTATTTQPQHKSSGPLIVGILIVALALAAAGWFIWRYLRERRNTPRTPTYS